MREFNCEYSSCFLFVNHYTCSASLLSFENIEVMVLQVLLCPGCLFLFLWWFLSPPLLCCRHLWHLSIRLRLALSLGTALSQNSCHIHLAKKFLKSELNTVWMAQLKQRGSILQHVQLLTRSLFLEFAQQFFLSQQLIEE